MRWRFLLVLLPVVLSAWEPKAEFTGRAGDFRKGGGALVWMPVTQQSGAVLFGQAQGGHFIDLWTGSAGGGYRRLVSRTVGVGVNVFCDVARSELDRTYLQGGVGVEVFGGRWIARANGYIPNPHRFRTVAMDAVLDIATNDIIDLFDTFVETALFGGEGEFGFGFCQGGNEVWAFAGVYGYNGPSFPAFVGPRARAEYRIRDLLDWAGAEVIVSGEVQWDRFHRTQGSAIVTVRLPFGRRAGRRPCLHIRDRMGDPVRRQPAIWTRQRRTLTTQRQRARVTGGPIWFVAQGANGIGTQLDPANIATPFALAQPGDAIVLIVQQVGMNTVTMAAGPYPLLQGSSMAAFGSLPQISLIVHGRPVKITKLSTQTEGNVLTDMAGNDLIRADGNNEIFNFATLNGARAIVSPAANLVRVRTMQFASPANTGIELNNATDSFINGATFTMPAARSIVINTGTRVALESLAFTAPNVATPLEINNGTAITLNGFSAVGIANNIDAITFSGNGLTVSSANFNIIGPGAGTGAGFNLTNATNVHLNGTAAQPITITNMGRGVVATNSSNIAMTSTNITGSANNGVEFTTVSGTTTYSASNVNTSAANAVVINNSSGNMIFNSIGIDGAAQGYSMDGNTGDITINDATLQAITNQAIVVPSLTGGSLNLDNLHFRAGLAAVQVGKTDGTTGTVNFTNSTITGGMNGMLMSVNGARTLNVNVNNIAMSGILVGDCGNFVATGTGVTMNNKITNVTMTNVNGDGFLISGEPGTNATVRTLVEGCKFGSSGAGNLFTATALQINFTGAVAPGPASTFDATVKGCSFENVGGAGGLTTTVSILSQGNSGTMTVALDDNDFIANGMRGTLCTWIGGGNSTSINLTESGNRWAPAAGNVLPFLEIDASGSTGRFCTNINTNTSLTVPSISLSSLAADGAMVDIVAPALPLGSQLTTAIAVSLLVTNTVPLGSVTVVQANPPGPARYTVVASCPTPALPPE